MNIFDFFKRDNKYLGANLPTQNDIDSQIHFQDIVATAAPVKWLPLDINNLPSWPQYDQNATYECVAHTDALTDSILYQMKTGNEIKFSPTWIYSNRVNKPTAGMVGTDVFKISKNIGGIPYELLPTPQTEIEANNVKVYPWFSDIAKVFQSDSEGIIIPIKDMDTLVSIQQVTGKPIMVWFEFNWGDWARQIPIIGQYFPALRHSVTFVPSRDGKPSYGLYNGEKAIVIQDSTGLSTSLNGKRIITESFYNKYNIFAMYKMRFKFDVKQGERYDGSIISLQKCLRSIGLFPTNVEPVENYGRITKGAVIKFQALNGVTETGILDDVTRALLIKQF